MKVHVHSRRQVEKLPARPGVAVVSINNSHDSPVNLYGTWEAVLRLSFDDIIEERHEEYGRGYVLFSEEVAHTVVSFVRAHQNFDFVVHCAAGISRSVAVGMFISQLYEAELKTHATPDTSHHNSHVLRTLRKVAKIWPFDMEGIQS